MSKRHRRHRGASGRSSNSSVPSRSARPNLGFECLAQQLPLRLLLLARFSKTCRLAIYLPTPPFQGVDPVSISTSDFTYSRRYLFAEATWTLRLPHSKLHEATRVRRSLEFDLHDFL